MPPVNFDGLKITSLKIVPESPKHPLKFNSSAAVKISTESQINSQNLKKLKDLTLQPHSDPMKNLVNVLRRIFHLSDTRRSPKIDLL